MKNINSNLNNTRYKSQPSESHHPRKLKRSSRAYFLYYIATQAVFDRGIFILFLLSQEFTNAEIGILQSVLFASAFILEIPTGLLGDKYGRKKSVIMGLLTYIGYCFGVISFTGFAAFVFFYAIYGLAMSLVSGSDRSLIYDLYKQENRESSFIKLESLSRSVGSIVLGLAIILGGVLQTISWDMVYLAYAGALVLSLLAISFVPEPKIINEHHEEDFLVVREASRYFLVGAGRAQLPIILFMALVQCVTVPYLVFSQSFFKDMGLSVEAVAWIIAIGQFVCSIGYFTSDKLPPKHRLNIAFIICPLVLSVLFLISQLGTLAIIIGVFFMICFIESVISPIYINHLNQTFESKIRAFSNSFDSFIQTLFISIGFYLYGELSTRFDFSLVAQLSFLFPLIAVVLSRKYLSHQNIVTPEKSYSN